MEEGRNNNSTVIKTELNGLLRLEHYKDFGYVVTIQVDKSTFFYVQLNILKPIIDEFAEIAKLKGAGNVGTDKSK